MDWIDVEKELPPDGEIVYVLCLIPDFIRGVLCQGFREWTFQGIFLRYKGWKVYFHEDHVAVIAWSKIDNDFESKFKDRLLTELK